MEGEGIVREREKGIMREREKEGNRVDSGLDVIIAMLLGWGDGEGGGGQGKKVSLYPNCYQTVRCKWAGGRQKARY